MFSCLVVEQLAGRLYAQARTSHLGACFFECCPGVAGKCSRLPPDRQRLTAIPIVARSWLDHACLPLVDEIEPSVG